MGHMLHLPSILCVYYSLGKVICVLMVGMCSKAIWTWTKSNTQSNITFVNSLCIHTLSAVTSMALHELDLPGTDLRTFVYVCHWEVWVFLFKISNKDECKVLQLIGDWGLVLEGELNMAVNVLLWSVYCATTVTMDELTGLIMVSMIDCFVVVSVRFMI